MEFHTDINLLLFLLCSAATLQPPSQQRCLNIGPARHFSGGSSKPRCRRPQTPGRHVTRKQQLYYSVHLASKSRMFWPKVHYPFMQLIRMKHKHFLVQLCIFSYSAFYSQQKWYSRSYNANMASYGDSSFFETAVSGEFRALEDEGTAIFLKLQSMLLKGHQIHMCFSNHYWKQLVNGFTAILQLPLDQQVSQHWLKSLVKEILKF